MCKKSTKFENLAIRIKKELGIELINFKRLYPGYWQKNAGRFSWIANEKTTMGGIGPNDYGSTYTATELLNHKGKLIVMSNNNEIVPD